MRFEYDERLRCWTLRRYADVRTALLDSRRFAFSRSLELDDSTHGALLRTAISKIPDQDWLRALERIPPADAAKELLAEWIEPWCHQAALHLATLTSDPGNRLLTLARRAFTAGAVLDAPAADDAFAELASILPSALGPLTVQTFVAVSQTLTAFLGNAVAILSTARAVYPHKASALEELLRLSGPSVAVIRFLRESIKQDSGETLPRGERVALLLQQANRDPDRFADPHRLDFERNAGGHLAFGHGTHACVGAVLIRAAAPVALRQLTPRLETAATASIVWPEDVWPEQPRLLRSPLAIQLC